MDAAGVSKKLPNALPKTRPSRNHRSVPSHQLEEFTRPRLEDLDLAAGERSGPDLPLCCAAAVTTGLLTPIAQGGHILKVTCAPVYPDTMTRVHRRSLQRAAALDVERTGGNQTRPCKGLWRPEMLLAEGNRPALGVVRRGINKSLTELPQGGKVAHNHQSILPARVGMEPERPRFGIHVL